MLFLSKKIVVCVTGGIAAYKACEIIRELKKAGSEVRVAMTGAAQEFVSALTFATLSENPVSCSLFEGTEKMGIAHIDLARWCDLLVVCPATANILGKIACGVADEIVSTTIMATKSTVLLCPSMNQAMWENSIVQENVAKLKKHGYEFVEPAWGAMATASEGEGFGRLADGQQIIQKIKSCLLGTDELKGKKVLVTAGATRESIDPVRFITNHASGKMGFALAEAAKLKGAEVVLIAGVNHLESISGIKYIEVTSVEEMKNAVDSEYENTDMLIMAAAVSDFKPAHFSTQKLKKKSAKIQLEFQKTTDILAELGKKKVDCLHVGFALETENGVANATRKLHSKNLDLIVLNNPLEPGAAFAEDTNVVTLIAKDGSVENIAKLPKSTLAKLIIEKACQIKKKNFNNAAIA